MKRAGRKPKQKKISLTETQLKKARQDITTDAVSRVYLLFMLAARDEFGMSDKQMCNLTERFNDYAGRVDELVVDMEEVKEIIEKNVGVQLKGWT